MNGTSFFYNHSSQWRYEKLEVKELLSPLARPQDFSGSLVDFNVRAERHGLAALRAAAGDQPAAPGRRRPGLLARARWTTPSNSSKAAS
jgi:respiratory nitrate reductase alpha subunit apoprotein